MKPSRRSVKRATGDAFRTSALMVVDEIPTVVGIVLVVVIHISRSRVVPVDPSTWTRILDLGLLWAEIALLLSLLAAKGIDLAGELAEAVVVRILRLRQLWRTGSLSRLQPPLPGDDDDGDS